MGHFAYRLLPVFAAALAFCALAGSAFGAGSGEPESAPPAQASRDIPGANPLLNLNLHVYGFSYHTDRQGVRRNRLGNEVNLGFGLNYAFHQDARGTGFVEAGVYRDSGGNMAKLAGVGYQFKLGEHWSLGGALVGARSPTYNRGRFFVAPIPIVSYDLGIVKLNATYVPRYKQYNEFAAFGFYFSIPFSR